MKAPSLSIVTDFFRKRQDSQWLTFAAFMVVFFSKLIIWHIDMFADIDIWLDTHIISALWFSILLLLCRHRPWWTLGVLLLLNLWMLSNYIFFPVWHCFITVDDIHNLGNLKGFESSLTTDLKLRNLCWLIPDIFYILFLCWCKPAPYMRWRQFLIMLAISIALIPVRQIRRFKEVLPLQKEYNYETGIRYYLHIVEPLYDIREEPRLEAGIEFRQQSRRHWEGNYIHKYGIADYGIAMLVFDWQYNVFMDGLTNNVPEISEEQQKVLDEIYNPEESFTPKRSLIVILVESLESWAIDAEGQDSLVMPNLKSFMQSHNTFFAPRLNSMVLHGGSSDGQMMLLTGLAPLTRGATIPLFCKQPFPNYCHFYPSSRTLNPAPGTWKQDIINPNYGIKMLEESDSIRSDEGLFHRLNSIKQDSISFTLLITISTHVPFPGADEVKFRTKPDMSEKISRYLQALHYLDIQLGKFLNRLQTDSALINTDIVITSDHSIMYAQDKIDLQNYMTSHNIDDSYIKDYQGIPLVIYSPTFTESVINTEDAYQIDLYPTILDVIGCDSTKWKGVGKSLIGNNERNIPLNMANSLSEYIIRSNYFSNH